MADPLPGGGRGDVEITSLFLSFYEDQDHIKDKDEADHYNDKDGNEEDNKEGNRDNSGHGNEEGKIDENINCNYINDDI